MGYPRIGWLVRPCALCPSAAGHGRASNCRFAAARDEQPWGKPLNRASKPLKPVQAAFELLRSRLAARLPARCARCAPLLFFESMGSEVPDGEPPSDPPSDAPPEEPVEEVAPEESGAGGAAAAPADGAISKYRDFLKGNELLLPRVHEADPWCNGTLEVWEYLGFGTLSLGTGAPALSSKPLFDLRIHSLSPSPPIRTSNTQVVTTEFLHSMPLRRRWSTAA